MKKTAKFLLLILFSIYCFCLCSCSLFDAASIKYVTEIEKTSSTNLSDFYTITYNDGTKSTIKIENGKDGKDGLDFSLDALFESFKKEYGENATYDDFLKKTSQGNLKGNLKNVNRNLLSCLKVYAEFSEKQTSGLWPKNKQTQTIRQLFSGSAIVFKIENEDAFILTNYHVVYDVNSTSSNKISDTIHVCLYGSESVPTLSKDKTNYVYDDYAIPCEFIGGSISTDVAILKANAEDLKKINADVQAVRFADGYAVGESAIAIGNPNDGGISVTQGIVSVDNEYISLNIDGKSRLYRSLRIDTPIYSGNSGGGLFNADGELIGITNAGNQIEENVNYAIPIQIVKSVADNVLFYYKDGNSLTNNANKITLGVTLKGENARFVFDKSSGIGSVVEDVVVENVSADSISERIGLKNGDHIHSILIDGKEFKIDRCFQISDYLFDVYESSNLSFYCASDGEQKITKDYLVKFDDLSQIA